MIDNIEQKERNNSGKSNKSNTVNNEISILQKNNVIFADKEMLESFLSDKKQRKKRIILVPYNSDNKQPIQHLIENNIYQLLENFNPNIPNNNTISDIIDNFIDLLLNEPSILSDYKDELTIIKDILTQLPKNGTPGIMSKYATIDPNHSPYTSQRKYLAIKTYQYRLY